MSGKKQQTEVIHASELEQLAERIFDLRDPNARKDYRRALRKYERQRDAGGHKEVRVEGRDPFIQKGSGYNFVDEDGRVQVVARPALSRPVTYGHSGYSKGYFHARTYGLLAEPRYNRDIRDDRVTKYAEEMAAGRWRDLLSDPISITEDGHVLNGQHRIAAASEVARYHEGGWGAVENDPAFLVIWNVAPIEAHFADGSRRTQRDEKTIADRLLGELGESA